MEIRVKKMERSRGRTTGEKEQTTLLSAHRYTTTLSIQVFFFNSHIGGVESELGPLGTAATSALLYLSRGIVMTENLVE
jgi:hypothetical protein